LKENMTMKKLAHILLLVFVLSACSFSADQLPFGAPPNTATITLTPVLSDTPTPSVTPTKPTPTFTLTPTLIGYKSPTPTPENTSTPTVTMTLTDIYSNITPFTPTPNVKRVGFKSIVTSSTVFYKGSGGCDPNSVKFTIETSHDTKATFVVLFVRLVSKTSGAKSEWTSITINNEGADIFTYSLLPSEIKAVDGFENPWVQYQLVATTASSQEVGRTGIFDEYLTLLRCVPTETPSPTITPTVLKP
jgi:hypothetical protein